MTTLTPRTFALMLVACTVLIGLCSLAVGSTGWQGGLGVAQQIVLEIRLPRSLGAWTAGALLGLAGALAQGLFRNPLADPYLLGSASGASLGVALVLVALPVLSGGFWVLGGLTGAAFVGALLAVMLTLLLARGVQQTSRLLLSGVVVGVLLGALAQMVLLLSPAALPQMQAFLWGSTAWVGWPACAMMAMVWLLSVCVAGALARALDALSLGEATAQSLGLPLGAMRLALVCVLALATGAAVAQTGLIAFVGLAAPHCVRSCVQVTYARMVWLVSAVGGLLLMLADMLARGIFAPQELPVGLVTAVIGGLYLCAFMHRRGLSRGSA